MYAVRNAFAKTAILNTLFRGVAKQLFALADRYRPEDAKEKRDRLKQIAAAKAEGKDAAPSKKPVNIKVSWRGGETTLFFVLK